jgi:small-conductance mechanosensitive channel
VISGFFLMGEQPFVVGDVIQVGGTTGAVLSIDTLSVKLRTFDNKFVRIPNESLIKSEVTNVTRFPIRRVDLPVGIAYKEDVERATEILLDCADRNPHALMEPQPVVFIDGFGDSSVNLRLGVWATREEFLVLKNQMLAQVKRRFDDEGIEIPFPHRTLYSGAITEPLPIRVVGGGSAGAPTDPTDLDAPPVHLSSEEQEA